VRSLAGLFRQRRNSWSAAGGCGSAFAIDRVKARCLKLIATVSHHRRALPSAADKRRWPLRQMRLWPWADTGWLTPVQFA